MKPRLLMIAALLSALPASGDVAQLSPEGFDTLSSVDSLPDKADVDSALPAPAVDTLLAIAIDPTMDLGVQLRSIRMLPLYCPDGAICGTGVAVHDTLLAIITDYITAPSLTPRQLLRMRAAVEALGATQSALDSDANTLAALLYHDSRDVRTTVVHALHRLGSCAAVAPLQLRDSTEPSAQVKIAILGALQDLKLRCP